jgi:hypothetical protein
MISNPFATDIHSPAITGTTNDTVSSTRVWLAVPTGNIYFETDNPSCNSFSTAGKVSYS